jgi:superfamily II DNA or RNA helicase
MMTYRPFTVDEETGEIGEFPHFALFNERNWGLIIYDEVHLLPAPVFRITAEIQVCRGLGLTTTLLQTVWLSTLVQTWATPAALGVKVEVAMPLIVPV